MSAGAVYAVIVAAGSSTRFGMRINKVFLRLRGEAVLRHAVRPFLRNRQIAGVYVVIKPTEKTEVLDALQRDASRVKLVSGGSTRQESVLAGLRALPEDAEFVLVHDGARPLVTDRIVNDCLETMREKGSAVACTRVTDTIKRAKDGVIQRNVARDDLRAVQTPQGFRVKDLVRALEAVEEKKTSITDEASAMERLGLPVHLVECEDVNLKITSPADEGLAEGVLHQRMFRPSHEWHTRIWGHGMLMPRVGTGYDVHRLVPGRRLVLCGVEIPYERGLEGHSDADVAVHALMDAILGAACMDDIGELFPDTDELYRGADSIELLAEVMRRIRDVGLFVTNVDLTIVAQEPKLQDYMEQMHRNLRREMPSTAINIKATTTEGLGFAGRGEGIAAQAVAMLVPNLANW